MTRALALAIALSLTGCGRLVDGQYLGDAAIRLSCVIRGDVPPVASPVIGVAWLGFGGLAAPLDGIDTATLPVTTVALGESFTFDVIGAPPDVGRYITADDARILPVTMRLARVALLDDVDHDGKFALDDAGNVAAPDRLVALAASQALLYVDTPPPDARALAGDFLSDWSSVDRGYHVLALDGSAAMPDAAAHVIADTSTIVFSPPSTPVSW
jgi:hypothetical protein